MDLKNAMSGRRLPSLRRCFESFDDWFMMPDGRGYWVRDNSGIAYRVDANRQNLQRFDHDTQNWVAMDFSQREQSAADRSDLARYRTVGTPSILLVHSDESRCIMTNLVWNIGESPEVAQVINPTTGVRTQISQTDLDKNPFKLNNQAAGDDNPIRITFDHASMNCDNQLAMSDERTILRKHGTVMNIMRSIKAMTRMYPTLHDTDGGQACRTQQEFFVCLAKVSGPSTENEQWKVKSSPSAARRR